MKLITISIISLLIYFFPTMIGSDKKDSTAIFILNLLLGWTLVGWVVALVWAASKDDKTNDQIVKMQSEQKAKLEELSNNNNKSKNSMVDEIKKLNELREQNLISQEEFNSLIAKIISSK